MTPPPFVLVEKTKKHLIVFSFLFFSLQLLATYTTFCGIAIQNAQIFEACNKEYERNKVSVMAVYFVRLGDYFSSEACIRCYHDLVSSVHYCHLWTFMDNRWALETRMSLTLIKLRKKTFNLKTGSLVWFKNKTCESINYFSVGN